tara:strand:- start:145 stop:294 length:150 start_codon:yes stop_codon:yes gene_type:complete
MRKKDSDRQYIDWQYLYLSIVDENRNLKKQIQVLESILRMHIPIIGEDK